MTIENQIRHELEQAGYRFVRRGKHELWLNETLKHTITICTSTHDQNAVRIIKGLIRRGIRRAQA